MAFEDEINRLRWGDFNKFDPYFFPRVGILNKNFPQNSNAPRLLLPPPPIGLNIDTCIISNNRKIKNQVMVNILIETKQNKKQMK